MPIIVPDIISERGKEDAKRNREKQKEVIKKHLPYIIADESIITGKHGKIVKIPIKVIDIPYFRPGKEGKGIGVGQGKGKPGDVLGGRPGAGKPGKPGNEPGRDYIETEMDIEEVIEMMLEDLGLPRLEEKDLKQLIVEFGYKVHGTSKTGPWALLHRRKTAKEGMRRFWALLHLLQSETGKPELACFDALRRANGNLEEARMLLKDENFIAEALSVEPFPIFESDDLRFRKVVPQMKQQSQAVIIAMMDVSGSMTTEKKYLARSMLFWLTAFLRKLYERVEIRFIVHDIAARHVEEEFFFRVGESGGTFCYAAYELAGSLIETEYPPDAWNVYVWHFSDGDDYDPERTVGEARKLFAKNIAMLGYGEIQPNSDVRLLIGGTRLMYAFKAAFSVQEQENKGLTMIVGKQEPLLGVLIQKKEHILPALKQFLMKERWGPHV